MSKKLLILTTAVAFVFSLALAGGAAMASDNGPAEMVLKTVAGKKPANFNHAKHQEKFKCGDCHHGKDDHGKQVPYADGQAVQKCDTCHNKEMMADVKINSFKGAAHANCKGCHKAHQEAGAPTKCTGCHPSKKK